VLVEQGTVPARTDPAPAGKSGDDAAGQMTPQAQAWMARNPWFNDPKYKAQAAAALAINADLGDAAKAGTGPKDTDPKYYAELDRRLAATGVRIPRANGKGDPPSGGRQPVDGGNSDFMHGEGRPSKVQITKGDIAMMQSLGLDPTNREHVKHYALEKARS
jgi:hypothetical protein